LPVVALTGTGATMLDALQLVGTAEMPLNFTVLEPCVAPKFVPLIVTEVPTNPDIGFRLVMLGATAAGFTVNVAALLVIVPAVLLTTTINVEPLSVVAVAGVV
jgi:hypothetical protein